MEYKQSKPSIKPRLIIHGGAGNILPSNLPPLKYKAYHDSLLQILADTHHFLTHPPPPSSSSSSYAYSSKLVSSSALDTVAFAVTHLENNPLFNSGHGAVFTRDGINELEASVMVSKGKKKRGVGVMGLQHVKNPIRLAREMLIRGEKDLEGGNGEHRGPMVICGGEDEARTAKGTGAQGHCQLHKFSAEKLAADWGLEIVEPEYFFVQARWDEHVKGLEKEERGGVSTWDEDDFFPQGTCGAVALDSEGVVACATSTGGMTNKLSGRIGDTPTLGAGFWAEEWEEDCSKQEAYIRQLGPALVLSETLKGLMADCFPNPTIYSPVGQSGIDFSRILKGDKVFRSSGMSGTGNGDSFLRLNAVRTASAIARYRGPKVSLQDAITEVTGPGGDLVKSAGSRWRKTGEGEGGIIGIELIIVTDSDGNTKSSVSNIVDDYNCGGMFRAAVNEHGKAVMRVWKPNQHDGLEAYEGEGREYDLREWISEKRYV